MSTVPRPSLETSRIARKSLGRVWDQQDRKSMDSREVSMASLDTSRIAVKFLVRVWIP